MTEQARFTVIRGSMGWPNFVVLDGLDAEPVAATWTEEDAKFIAAFYNETSTDHTGS